MDEEISPNVEEAEAPTTPETDPILATLEAEDDTPSEVEAPESGESEPEAPAEGEQEDQEEELQAESDPKEEARLRYEERQRDREARTQQMRELAQQRAEEIRQGAEDEYDQRLKDVEARDFEREVERYNERVSANEDRLISEFERAKANPDLQIFNPESPEFNIAAYNKAIKDFDAGYLQRDELGNIGDVKGSLLDHLTETADLLRGAQKSGQVQQVRASKQMRANADTKPAATPKEPQKDAILDILKSD